MKAEHIEKLLQALGCSKIKQSGDKIRSTCPLALWRHGGGTDKHPSLAVFVRNEDHSGVNCMSGRCGFHGSLMDLVYKVQWLSGRDLSAQLMFISEHNEFNLNKRLTQMEKSAGFYAKPRSALPGAVTGGKDYSDPLTRAALAPALPDETVALVAQMSAWIDAEAYAYLTGPARRLTDATIKRWNLGWHPEARRISVPQYDYAGRLVNLSGRQLSYWPDWVPLSGWEASAPKWMHASGFNRELFLFGEDKIVNPNGKSTAFLVEGAFDAIYLDQCGIPNVLGVNGSFINDTQVEKLVKWFDFVVLIMDGDAAGIAAAERIDARISPLVNTAKFLIGDARDPNQISDAELLDLKSRFAI